MIIRLPLKFEGPKGELTLQALFDSDATFSCIRPDLANKLDNPSVMLHPLELLTASEGIFMRITEAMRADFYFDTIRLSDEFMVVPNLSEEIIIGANTLQKWRIKLDFENDTIYIDPKVAKLILKELK